MGDHGRATGGVRRALLVLVLLAGLMGAHGLLASSDVEVLRIRFPAASSGSQVPSTSAVPKLGAAGASRAAPARPDTLRAGSDLGRPSGDASLAVLGFSLVSLLLLLGRRARTGLATGPPLHRGVPAWCRRRREAARHALVVLCVSRT